MLMATLDDPSQEQELKAKAKKQEKAAKAQAKEKKAKEKEVLSLLKATFVLAHFSISTIPTCILVPYAVCLGGGRTTPQ